MKRIMIVAASACLIALPAAGQSGSGASGSGSTSMGMNAPGAANGPGEMGTGSGSPALGNSGQRATGSGSIGTAAERSAASELDAAQFAPPAMRVNGHVTDISRTTGAIRLQSASAPLRLHFPPETVSALSDDTPVIVHIAYSFGNAGAAAADIPPAANSGAMGSTGTTAGSMPGAQGQVAPGSAGAMPGGPVASIADEYSVKGTISNVDRNFGLVTFTPAPMMLTVYLPNQPLEAIKPGDTVSAEVAYLRTSKAGGDATTRAGDAPAAQRGSAAMQGAHWMNATVSDVDQARGVFTAKADKYTLQLPIPAAIRDQITPNKTIAVNLSFEPDSCS